MKLRPITLTHARLRAAQGDAALARRICRALLELRPGDERAAELLARLDRVADQAPARRSPGGPRATRGASAAELKRQFGRLVGSARAADPRVARLERWARAVVAGSRSTLSC